MARILIAWELGGGYGHMDAFPRLASALRERGHEVLFALRDLARAERVLGDGEFRLAQAPIWLPATRPLPAAANFAELLFRVGYLDPSGLRALARAWRGLCASFAPDLLVLEYAPTALLATQGLGIPRVLYGTPFTCPPPVRPMPPFLARARIPRQRIEDSEARVLAVVNRVLQDLGADVLGGLGDLFRVEATALGSLPELDPFQDLRGRDARYWGPLNVTAQGEAPDWPPGSGPCLFGYLKPDYPHFERVMEQIAKLGARALLHVPGLSAEIARRFDRPQVRLAPRPVDLAPALAGCDVAVFHAGHGMTALTLLAGRPALLLPTQVEQELNAERAATQGAALVVHPAQTNPDLRKMLGDLLRRDSYRGAAEAFAARHAGFDANRSAAALAEDLEALLPARRE